MGPVSGVGISKGDVSIGLNGDHVCPASSDTERRMRVSSNPSVRSLKYGATGFEWSTQQTDASRQSSDNSVMHAKRSDPGLLSRFGQTNGSIGSCHDRPRSSDHVKSGRYPALGTLAGAARNAHNQRPAPVTHDMGNMAL